MTEITDQPTNLAPGKFSYTRLSEAIAEAIKPAEVTDLLLQCLESVEARHGQEEALTCMVDAFETLTYTLSDTLVIRQGTSIQ